MTEDTPTEAETVSQESKPNWRRDLESRAAAGDEAVAELAQLRRELSFRDAGVDPASKQGQYFMRGYDGELTVDAIRAEAAELGLVGESQTLPVQTAPVDYGAEQRIAMASDDTGPVTDPNLDVLIRQATNPEELRAVMEANGYTWNAAV